MYTATPSSKHGQYTSHICDRRWPPAHTQHTTTNNNEEQQEQYHKYHNHHNHHQQPRYHQRQLDNGPNDASRVVWAIRWVFFFSSCFFLLLNNIYSNYITLKLRRGSGKAATRRTGPNDAIRVVWAISTSFFNSSCLFLLINNIYRYYNYIKATEGLREGGGEEIGPKWRETHRLGHSVSIFNFYSCFL